MKNFLNSLKNIFKSKLSRDPFEKTDLGSTYFQKAVFKDLPFENNSKSKTNYVVEDKLKVLNRTILTGISKKMVESKIQELLLQHRFDPLKRDIKEIIEVLDYGCKNNTPVRINYIQRILPNIEIDEKNVLNEENYESWLKNKKEEEELPGDTYNIADVIGLRNEGEHRGRQSHEQWNTNKGDNKWRRFK